MKVRNPAAAVGCRSRSGRVPALVAGLVVAALPFAAYTGFVLHQFYVKGSFLQDAGWFAFVISQGGLRLASPASLGGGSFFATHVSPIFVVAPLIRRALPVSDTQFLAGFIGLCHALPGLGVFWALRAALCRRRPAAVALAALLSIAFAFNGLALAIARYPHIEILVAGTVILFAAALAQRRMLPAALFFALALATREDAGFHLFALVAVLIALNRWHGIGWSAQRAEIVFAAIGFGYSCVVLFLQLTFSPGPSALGRIYLGEPPFARLTWEVVGIRLLGWLIYRAYVVLPAIIAAIWAARTRNPYILVGYLAFLPWAALHLVAHSDIAGTLSSYYAYPFLIAACWPLVGLRLDPLRRGVVQGAASLLPFAAMLAASFVSVGLQYNPGGFDLARGFLMPPSLARQAATDRAVAQLVRSKAELGAVFVDGSVLALAPNDFSWQQSILGREESGRGPFSRPPDAIAYFVEGYEANKARALAAANALDHYYRAPDTSLRLATRQPLAAAPLLPLFVALDRPD